MRLIWTTLVSIVLLILVAIAVGVPPAQARLMQETLASGEDLYKSLRSLSDNHGYSWQLVAFKADAADSAYLRLVGFPSVPPIDHQAPLLVKAESSKADVSPITVADQTPQFGRDAPLATVAQYPLAPILAASEAPTRLQLTIPAQADLGGSSSDLRIPKSIVTEWWMILSCETAVCRFNRARGWR